MAPDWWLWLFYSIAIRLEVPGRRRLNASRQARNPTSLAKSRHCHTQSLSAEDVGSASPHGYTLTIYFDSQLSLMPTMRRFPGIVANHILSAKLFGHFSKRLPNLTCAAGPEITSSRFVC